MSLMQIPTHTTFWTGKGRRVNGIGREMWWRRKWWGEEGLSLPGSWSSLSSQWSNFSSFLLCGVQLQMAHSRFWAQLLLNMSNHGELKQPKDTVFSCLTKVKQNHSRLLNSSFWGRGGHGWWQDCTIFDFGGGRTLELGFKKCRDKMFHPTETCCASAILFTGGQTFALKGHIGFLKWKHGSGHA